VSPKLLGEQYQIDKETCLSWTVEKCPAQEACPIKMDMEGYIRAIAEGKFKEALDITREVTAFPATLGRVCHHPCEEKCKRDMIEEPVAIRELKRFAADYELRNMAEKPTPYPRAREEKVAIIGSGPAGLTAALDLVKQGYGVTVFEASPVAGGMLAKTIPDFMLPKEIVEIEVGRIAQLGVEIKTNTPVGKDLTLDDLWKQGYKAIFLATGMPGSLSLKITGVDLVGVHTALPILESAKLGERVELGEKVTVIGGGNVAIDVARTVLRWGVKEVNVTCLESRAEMPAFEWEILRAVDEGVKIHCSLAPQRFRAGDGKKVAGVDFKRVEATWLDTEGRIRWSLREGPGAEYSMDTDSVIIAIGQATNLSYLGDSGLDISNRGTISVDPYTLATNRPGIFAGGDVVKGAGTVVESIAHGHEAAISIDRYLNGKDIKEGRGAEAVRRVVTGEDKTPRVMSPRERQAVFTLPVGRRIRSFEEVELGFTEEEAIAEAERCLKCKTCDLCIAAFGCIALIWEPNEALATKSPQIDLDVCIGCEFCPQICPYESLIKVKGMVK